MVANKIQQHSSKVMLHVRAGLITGIQGYFSTCDLDTIKHIIRGKDNHHLVISVDGAKLFSSFLKQAVLFLA